MAAMAKDGGGDAGEREQPGPDDRTDPKSDQAPGAEMALQLILAGFRIGIEPLQRFDPEEIAAQACRHVVSPPFPAAARRVKRSNDCLEDRSIAKPSQAQRLVSTLPCKDAARMESRRGKHSRQSGQARSR